jgi:DNA-directed RNA polymerase subunit RPC12/RpoP
VTVCGDCGRAYEETKVDPGQPCPACGGELHHRRFLRDDHPGELIEAARTSDELVERLVGIGA